MRMRGHAYVRTEEVGGRGGHQFLFPKSDEIAGTVTDIVTWWDEDCLRGIKIYYSLQPNDPDWDGSCDRRDLHEEQFHIGNNSITELSLWANSNGRCSGIEMILSDGRTFRRVVGGNKHQLRAHSGICVGIFGYAGADIDSLGFMFLPL
eukprot:TRINITY_DN1136_c0_g1_i3.p1 TRINITY_DN1136_c0_g1~~TRINITY_DN1136_c0_g1_i3.p1  ORF type:complete len:149 (-),score=16.72 TRINITY_DN1136_c0_g1_i3:548-994(-)